jgi:hypothetical protein
MMRIGALAASNHQEDTANEHHSKYMALPPLQLLPVFSRSVSD